MAEWLVTNELDLLAQVEAQLRAIHQTMRSIEKLRTPQSAGESGLSDAERGKVMCDLSRRIAQFQTDLSTQADCCHTMLETIEQMKDRLRRLALPFVPAGKDRSAHYLAPNSHGDGKRRSGQRRNGRT